MNPDDKTLWLGCLSDYMDANFILRAFRKMGEDVNSVKLAHDKYTGQFAQYCFVEFPSAEIARRVILTVNGKVIPDSKPPITFKMSYAINPADPGALHGLIAGNLPNDFMDAQLFSLFGRRYYSCRSAKIFRNPDGSSKGKGLIRFADAAEQKQALHEMSGWKIHGRPLNLRIAYPRAPQRNNFKRPYDPDSHYREHGSYYNSAQWQMYDYPPAAPPGDQRSGDRKTRSSTDAAPDPQTVLAGPAYFPYGIPDPEDDLDPMAEIELEPYDVFDSIDQENEWFMAQSEDLYRAAESSGYFFYNPTSFKASDLEKEVPGWEPPPKKPAVATPTSTPSTLEEVQPKVTPSTLEEVQPKVTPSILEEVQPKVTPSTLEEVQPKVGEGDEALTKNSEEEIGQESSGDEPKLEAELPVAIKDETVEDAKIEEPKLENEAVSVAADGVSS